jgi:hypothetical protein
MPMVSSSVEIVVTPHPSFLLDTTHLDYKTGVDTARPVAHSDIFVSIGIFDPTPTIGTFLGVVLRGTQHNMLPQVVIGKHVRRVDGSILSLSIGTKQLFTPR